MKCTLQISDIPVRRPYNVTSNKVPQRTANGEVLVLQQTRGTYIHTTFGAVLAQDLFHGEAGDKC